MKKILIPIGTLFLSGLAYSQNQSSSAENYVYSKTYLEAVTTSSATAKQTETVQYFDGLGRPKQVINVKASPSGKDVVQHIEYDGFGRQVKDYLPVPQQGTQNGAIYTSPLSNATQPALYGAEKIYSEKILENSPLDRILAQKQVGNAWNDKPVQFGYDANTTADAVKKYTTVTTWVNGATSSVLSQSSNYAAAQLYKNTVTDEDGNITIEFKNGEGQVVLVRKMNGTQSVDTYYVYNEYNQLAYVIPPLASVSGAVDDVTLNNLCYQYKYDGRNRLVEKKLPGKAWEYMVYDKADRVIMTQDTNMKNGAINWGANLWVFIKYDKFGRVLYTGITTGGDRNTVQQDVNSTTSNAAITENKSTSPLVYSNMQLYYSNTAYPTNIVNILSVNYYDTYPSGTPTVPTQVLGQNVLTQDALSSNISTKSLPTASYVKNVENDGWTQNYTWYDIKGRAIGTHSVNHLGGYTKTETLLDFAGIPQKTNTYHKRDTNTAEVQVKERFVYNAQNMLLKHYHQADNNTEELLAENSYNEKGQLTSKKVGNNLQSIDYTYNIRGWMTGINDPLNLNGKLFGYNIRYQNPTDEEPSPKRYNGNISEVNWKIASNQILKRYAYKYDGLNRLIKGTFLNPDVVVPQNNWNNEQVSYDLNGNIKTLKRNSKNLYSNTAEQIDDLDYKYLGNRVTQIKDYSNNPTGYEGGGGDIEYDENGNIKTMPDKQIDQIGYNYLNLPNAFKIEGTKKKMIHLYRTDGAKLRKTLNFQKQDGSVYTTITDYLDGFQYLSTVGSEPNELDPMEFAYEQEAFIDNATTEHPVPVLSFFPTAEGFYDYEKKMYIYQYKDHLGNVRVSYKKGTNALAEITDQNDYYPFGMNILREEKAIFGVNSLYNYKYNGKELQESGMYDYEARFYMPDIGRWGVVDPLAETSRRWSSYNYAYNNPIRFIDPDGRMAVPPDDYIDASTGRYLGSDGAITRNVRVIYRNEWNNITSERGGSTSAEATRALQASSSIVTVNSTQINSNINNANNETIADQTRERQVWVGIEVTRGDVPTAQVTSVRGPSGTDGNTTITMADRTDTSGNLVRRTFDGTNLLPTAQVHTHNLTQEANKLNVPGTSTPDRNTSNRFQIPVYAVDSYTGVNANGNAVHRVMPNGTQTNNVGTTTTNNIGQESLNHFIERQKNP
ncbi:DUF6443 domain-containing protein [Chryseobacterium mucoviscidosis]|uniref:DUF6443 domain-containing protein n=1 Tax=Chryseobacterium mucoviscidosis TaxID=1945581 RepID=A0A202BWI7_9FLAO|nr:DUF6443 domain-containing protein [Chryseobacterium mucoviscidosis]OVE55840.1 hypothetical protein B0E34_16635 [Chryseobacterium mucoviscidosis]